MGRAQFEYDEIGDTFYYVIVSFYAVILFPLTHFLWPFSRIKSEIQYIGCRCEGDISKRARRELNKPWERTKKILKGALLSILWFFFLVLVYRVTQIKHEFVEYDPYKILQLDVDADVSEIKRKYRELSKLHHPDKGGKAETFDEIVKAYKALTDDEARENWRLYGNPDGPRATTFGIALPKWIVSEQYGNWVLALYVLIFLIILPVVVGLWWYNSIKYSADKVLIETTRLYIFFIRKTPSMEANRIIMILAGSFEFWRRFNSEIIERETDDVEVPRVMKELRNLGENKKETPFCHPWSIKARTLLHSHFTRVDLRSERLESDQTYVIGRCLALLEEFLRILTQMMFVMDPRVPTIDTLENTLRLFPMIVQGLWPKNSSLLQLPHIFDYNLSYLRKNRVITCQDLAQLNEFKRRSLLNMVSPEQYEDIVYVLSMMPKLEVETKIEVPGEDDKETVTVGSYVTIKVTLKRFSLLDLDKRKLEIKEGPPPKHEQNNPMHNTISNPLKDSGDGDVQSQQQSTPINKKRLYDRHPKKKPKKGGSKGGQKFSGKKQPAQKTASQTTEGKGSNAEVEGSPKGSRPPSSRVSNDGADSEDDMENNNENSSSSNSEDESVISKRGGGPVDDLSSGEAENDDQWDEDDDNIIGKKENILENEPTNHHEVHCPLYPGDKYEWWYLYLVDRKSRRLVSSVVPCKTLKAEKTIELRLPAPPEKGIYYLILNIRSDSYMDFDYSTEIKMEVHPAREPPQIKYEDTENEEDEKDETADSSADYTEGSDSEEDDT